MNKKNNPNKYYFELWLIISISLLILYHQDKFRFLLIIGLLSCCLALSYLFKEIKWDELNNG